MIRTSERLLKLLALLQSSRGLTAAELSARLEISERSVRNDVERLRTLGYPVQAERGRIGGYRLGAGANLPPLQLDDEEAIAIAIGLASTSTAGIEGIEEASIRALSKLQTVLPTRLRRRLEALQGYALRVPDDEEGPHVDSETVARLANACRDREVLRVRYLSYDGAESRRYLEPHRLVNWGNRWYLLAWDESREDWRTFRVDRFAQIDPVARRFDERPLPERDITQYIAGGVARAGWRYRASFVIEGPAEVVAARIGPVYGLVEQLGPDRCRLETGGDDLAMTAAYIGMLGYDFTFEGPPELADEFRKLTGIYERALARSGT